MKLLKDYENMSTATLICIGTDNYLLFEGETFPDDLHEVHTELEAYPTESYIKFYPNDIEGFFFDSAEVGNELDFDTWEEAEAYFEAKEVSA